MEISICKHIFPILLPIETFLKIEFSQLNFCNWVFRRIHSATQFPQLSSPRAWFRNSISTIKSSATIFPQDPFHNCGLLIEDTFFPFSKMDFCNYVVATVLFTLGLHMVDTPSHFSKMGFCNFLLATSFPTILMSHLFLVDSFLTVGLRSDADLTLTL